MPIGVLFNHHIINFMNFCRMKFILCFILYVEQSSRLLLLKNFLKQIVFNYYRFSSTYCLTSSEVATSTYIHGCLLIDSAVLTLSLGSTANIDTIKSWISLSRFVCLYRIQKSSVFLAYNDR